MRQFPALPRIGHTFLQKERAYDIMVTAVGAENRELPVSVRKNSLRRYISEREGGTDDETYQDAEYQKFTEYREKRRMRRVPDFLPVSLQDFLYSWESELRKYKIREDCHMRRGCRQQLLEGVPRPGFPAGDTF